MPDIINILRVNQSRFSPVVEFNPATDKLLSLDFTSNNTGLNDELLNDTDLFTQYIDHQLSAAAALYGIGGYGEHRTIYSRSDLFDSGSATDEPRRLHLGTDIWGKAGTRIMAAFAGVVHSYAFNDRRGDYGATIILYHELDDCPFYSLYGHLSLDSIDHLAKGQKIKQGNEFARFGSPSENGHWPPHLHFQLIHNIGDYSGDYPGVCKYGEREGWLANCPDPDLILQLDGWIKKGMENGECA